MTQPDHSQIMQAIGQLQGEMVGIRNNIQKSGEQARAVNEKVTKLGERVSGIELWVAKMQGASMGARLVAGGLVAFAATGLTLVGQWALRKFGGS